MDNKIITLESKKYELRLDNFEGPLDVLVYLIDKNKMNIYDISIAEIADQYLAMLKKQESLNLEIASEFIVMASTLLLLKSKKLLPNSDGGDEAELTEEELVRRILEYKKYKEITSLFKEKIQVYSKRYYKKPDAIELKKQEIERDFTSQDIFDSYKSIFEKNEEKKNEQARNIEKIAVYDNFSVSDKVKEIFKELFKRKKFVFGKMYSIKSKPKEEVVTAFSGVLELDRRNKIITHQEELFGDIVVSRKEDTLFGEKIENGLTDKEIEGQINRELIFGNYEFDDTNI